MLQEGVGVLTSGTSLASSLGYGMLSAVIPVLNAEMYIVAAAALVPRPQLPMLVAIFTLGTMLGKVALYLLADRLVRTRSTATRARVDLWVARLQRRRRLAWPVVLASAAAGFPPFYPVTLAAGVLRLGVVGLFTVGCIGLFVRFSAITWAAQGALTAWR